MGNPLYVALGDFDDIYDNSFFTQETNVTIIPKPGTGGLSAASLEDRFIHAMDEESIMSAGFLQAPHSERLVAELVLKSGSSNEKMHNIANY